MTPLEMYKLAEEQWNKLLKEEKENTPAGEGWSKEMDYWWNRLTVEERLKLISDARTELTEKFSKSFEELFLKDNTPQSNDETDTEEILEKIIKELEAEVGK